MTCAKIQSQITAFIDDELQGKELEEFINHVKSCSECREELEVYYTLLTAMKQLDEDQDLSDDFLLELDTKLIKTEEKIIHGKFVYYRKKGTIFFVLLVLSFVIGIASGLNNIEPPKKLVTKSTFGLRKRYHGIQYNSYRNELQEYRIENGLEEEILEEEILDEEILEDNLLE